MTHSNKVPFIAGNWKMNMNVSDAIRLADEIAHSSKNMVDAEIILAPPFTLLSRLCHNLQDSQVQFAGQNMFWETKGAYTGEISASMLKDIGCLYVILGHSERRQYFGETNQSVNKKIKAALEGGLIPIFCFGESFDERTQNKTTQKIESQIVEGLEGLDENQVSNIIFAYEPLWAIGTGLTATPFQAQEIHEFIRNKLTKFYGNKLASYAIILYGGSVKPDNAFSLIKEKDINGALVGGASLEAESFNKIIKEAIKAYKEKK